MCAICGFYDQKEANTAAIKALVVMRQRGREAAGLFDGLVSIAKNPEELPYSGSNHALGHVLHAMVGCVPQPLTGKGVLVTNCEIYNWQELAQTHGLVAQNDAEILLQLLDRAYPDIDSALTQLDGVYAFAYERDDKVILARDLLGIKPLFYSTERGLAFASERKALEQQQFTQVRELYPRTLIVYDRAQKTITEHKRTFFNITPEHTDDYQVQKEQVRKLLLTAVKKRIPDTRFGLLLSGGVDSSTLALLLQKNNPLCYVVGQSDSPDVIAAQAVAQKFSLPLKVITPQLSDIELELPKIVESIEDANPVKVAVATTFWFACTQAEKDGCKALFSGLGSEELFAGYERHRKSTAINKECLSGLRKLHERDLYRDDVITMRHGIELRLPFLDRELVEYALCIPASYKINEKGDKWILRDAALTLGVPHEHATRPKKAAQYGSGIMKQIQNLSKSSGSSASYLANMRTGPNKRLAALLSGGKDSVLALHIMHRMNYKISCCVTVNSVNPDSFMFHTPNVALTTLQTQAMRIPLITEQTLGEKEKELGALRQALARAKNDYAVEGVVVGAIQSQYQRERVEEIADELGLTVFAPLWQTDQLQELRTLLTEGYSVIFTKVAAEGLDESWLGAQLDEQRILLLEELHKKIGLHPAGEGGEYETLVIDAPLFEQKIMVRAAETIKDGLAATLNITDAVLTPK